jgi:hypothetical protein
VVSVGKTQGHLKLANYGLPAKGACCNQGNRVVWKKTLIL